MIISLIDRNINPVWDLLCIISPVWNLLYITRSESTTITSNAYTNFLLLWIDILGYTLNEYYLKKKKKEGKKNVNVWGFFFFNHI
jgi:hypothetical protein